MLQLLLFITRHGDDDQIDNWTRIFIENMKSESMKANIYNSFNNRSCLEKVLTMEIWIRRVSFDNPVVFLSVGWNVNSVNDSINNYVESVFGYNILLRWRNKLCERDLQRLIVASCWACRLWRNVDFRLRSTRIAVVASQTCRKSHEFHIFLCATIQNFL